MQSKNRMRIGLDFDNTLAGYDHVFSLVGKAIALLPDGFEGGKQAVRQELQRQPDGERAWMRLQGQVYGAYMHQAELIRGAGRFLRTCAERDVDVFIVSHKTQYGHFDPSKVDLRQAALTWMEKEDFFNDSIFSICRRNVYFCDTRSDKVARIVELGCDIFVDDLEEVFREPSFPHNVTRILFGTKVSSSTNDGIRTFGSWNEIERHVFAT